MDLPHRTWTLRQAEAALPDVQEVLSILQRLLERRAAAQAQIEDLRIVRGDDVAADAGRDGEDFRASVRDFQDAQNRILRVLSAFFLEGVEIDAAERRVDFLARSNGSTVCLCYREGDAGVGFWHDLAEPCLARRAVPKPAG